MRSMCCGYKRLEQLGYAVEARPDAAVHLSERVLPAVPIRHWIGSLPSGLRALLGYDQRFCAGVVGAFAQELLRSLRQRAKRLLVVVKRKAVARLFAAEVVG